jgi:hypothetical protein
MSVFLHSPKVGMQMTQIWRGRWLWGGIGGARLEWKAARTEAGGAESIGWNWPSGITQSSVLSYIDRAAGRVESDQILDYANSER